MEGEHWCLGFSLPPHPRQTLPRQSGLTSLKGHRAGWASHWGRQETLLSCSLVTALEPKAFPVWRWIHWGAMLTSFLPPVVPGVLHVVLPLLCAAFGFGVSVLGCANWAGWQGEDFATGMGLLWYMLKSLDRLPLISVSELWDEEWGGALERRLTRSCMLPFYHEPGVNVIAFAG